MIEINDLNKLDLNLEDFSTLEELYRVKNELKKSYAKDVLQKLYNLLNDNKLIELVSKHNYEEIHLYPANFSFNLSTADVRKFYNNKHTDIVVLKRKYITEQIIDELNTWTYEFIKQKEENIEDILTELRNKYPKLNINNFIIPNLFSLNIGRDVNICHLNYKFI